MKTTSRVLLMSVLFWGYGLVVNNPAQSSCLHPTGGNIVPNPGFEDAEDENSDPDGWLIWGSGDWDLDSPGRDNDSSTRSLKIDTDNGALIKFRTKDNMYIEVNPEFKYKFSYWAKGNASKFNLAWSEYDENRRGSYSGNDGIRAAYRQHELTEQWQQIDTIEFVPQDRTKYVKFYGIVDSGTVWIDDLSAVALTRARILHTVIYDFETFMVDLQTGGDYDVQDLEVNLKLKQATNVLTQATIDTLPSENVAYDFPVGGMASFGVGEYVIEARFTCDDNSTVFYEEIPVYVVEQPERTAGGVFRLKNETEDGAGKSRLTFDPYFPVLFGKTYFDDMNLLTSKGIDVLSYAACNDGSGTRAMIDPECLDSIAAQGMHAIGGIGYYDVYKDTAHVMDNESIFMLSHDKTALLFWSTDEPAGRYELSDMIEAYYSIRTSFDGSSGREQIPLAVSEESNEKYLNINSYPDDKTREDVIAYTNVADIVMDDVYRYSDLRGLLSMIAVDMTRLKKHSRGVKPPFIWLACGWKTMQPKITPVIFRAQTYMALVHGAKGIGYYSFYEPVTDTSPGWFLPRDNPALWTFMGDFMQELDMIKDIFLHGEDSDAVIVTSVNNATDRYGYTGAHYSAKTYINQDTQDNETYVFIVNGFDEDIEATVGGPGTGDSLTVDLPPHGTVFLVATDNACPDGTVCYHSDGEVDQCSSSTWCVFDRDSDGIPDFLDNCLSEFNPYQDDTDEDGIGNECDPCNDDSSCCDYKDTVADHVQAGRAESWAQWTWAFNEEEGKNHILRWDYECSEDTTILYENPVSNPGNYYEGVCSGENLVSCRDGIDNDNDYYIDCDDPDCDNDPHCTPDADND